MNTLLKHEYLVNRIRYAVAFLPLIWIVLFYGFAGAMVHYLGRWPNPEIDDSRIIVPDLPIYNLAEFILGWLFFLCISLVPVWLVLFAFFNALPDRRLIQMMKLNVGTVIFWIGEIGILYIVTVDPHKFLSWWLN